MLAADAVFQRVGAGSKGVVHGHFRSLDDGDIQQQRQILVRRVKEKVHAAVAGQLHTGNVGEASLVIHVLPRLLVARDHVLHRDPGAVGEGRVGFQIDRPCTVIRGDLILRAQNGGRIVLGVHREQPLIHQGHDHAVGVVAAVQGVHGAVGIVGQRQILRVRRDGFLRRVLPLHQEGVSRGDVGGIVDAPDAAGEAPQTEDKRQQHGYSLFHPVTS